MNRETASTVDYTLADQERMQRAPRYFEWQARLAAAEAGRRVLEVGCGLGNFTRHLLNRDLVIGIDVIQDCVDRLIERFPNQPNLIARRMDVQDSEFCRTEAIRAGFNSMFERARARARRPASARAHACRAAAGRPRDFHSTGFRIAIWPDRCEARSFSPLFQARLARACGIHRVSLTRDTLHELGRMRRLVDKREDSQENGTIRRAACDFRFSHRAGPVETGAMEGASFWPIYIQRH